MTLARDVAEVATQMLHCSHVFTDQELIEIARSQPEAWQQAVVRRETVSAPVSDAWSKPAMKRSLSPWCATMARRFPMTPRTR